MEFSLPSGDPRRTRSTAAGRFSVAPRAVSASTTLIMLLLFASSSSYPLPPAAATPNNSTDLSALLAFKDSVGDPLGVLAGNWTAGTSFCSWVGVNCSQETQRVTALQLPGLSLHGPVSPHLANLSFLRILNLGNNTLGGPIPDSIGRLPDLTTLNLEQNQLSGPIPPAILNMSSLTILSLAGNSLSGPLPQQNHTLMLPQIQWVSFFNNQLTGPIPPSFGLCRRLGLLALSRNNLIGPIPPELASLPELTALYLSDNPLTGTIPAALGNLTKLTTLELLRNRLQGGVPAELGRLPNLQLLSLGGNQLTGSIPASLCNASMLTRLDLSINNLTGPVPAQLGRNAPLLQFFNLQSNSLLGGLDFITSLSNCRALGSLYFSYNQLDGILPDSVGNLSTQLLRFSGQHNRIRGQIPAGIGNLSSLIALLLENNELTGAVPPSLARLQKLQLMYLSFNRLGGSIPQELGQLGNLNQLDLEQNSLVGSVPDSIGNLSKMQTFSLAANRLSSAIPMSFWNLTSLIGLYLTNNSLDGSIPPEVGNLKAIDTLELSWNRLSGNIPSALGGINTMSYLGLASNDFHGLIPQSFGGLININTINLASNALSGAIPESLASLRYLTTLNLSYNMLDGQVPEGGVFSNLTIRSLMGNAALCGVTRLGFPPCFANSTIANSSTSRHLIEIILPIFAAALILVACICLIVWRMRRRARTRDPADHSLHANNDYRLISYYELARATDNFSKANLLGRGGSGSVYIGCMDDGVSVAIKVFNLGIGGVSRSFDAECRTLRMLRHRNLVKIITTCSNLDFKALVLPLMPNGSLERWLYSDNCYLSLLQRVSIAIDVALALEYLHDHNVVHCDLKPSNVLLDQDMTAHVADFGIAKLLIDDSKSMESTSAPGTLGYMAPEYGASGRVSGMSDIYSYGIMLLEIFTRRRPTDGMFDGGSTLRQWVCEAHPAAVMEVVDNHLLRDEYTGARLRCLSDVIELGLLCSRDSPTQRIPMKDVIVRLEIIKKEYSSGSSTDEKLEKNTQPNMRTHLKAQISQHESDGGIL